jgi:hypothetical protein
MKNEVAVIENVTDNPHFSQSFHPYHATIVQHLTENNFVLRLQFCAGINYDKMTISCPLFYLLMKRLS